MGGLRQATVLAFGILAGMGWTGTALAQGDTWTSLGGPDGGIVRALAVDPVTPSTVYAATDGGGVFKSADGGGSWTAINAGLSSGSTVMALAVDPVTPSTVYAGTNGGGVLRSDDGGASWMATTAAWATPVSRPWQWTR
jgi:photosystem II stability/assembly factor-like uncharacterized protein